MNGFTVVVVSTNDSAPQVVYEVCYDDGIRTMEQAMQAAIKRAESMGDSYRFVAVGPTSDKRPKAFRAMDVMLANVWLNGGITAMGREWTK